MATSARIRRFQPSDEKLVLFAIAKANMEALAVANRKAYFHPLVLSLWVALSCVFVEFMQWWPSHLPGWLGYLRPIPAFASMAVPIMFLIDWINRPYFEKITQNVIRNSDLRNITNHYSKSPGSGFWMLEYGDKFVGLIALDASPSNSSEKSTKTGFIRHFYVDEPYRPADIQNDLLRHAVNYAFKTSSTLERVEAPDSPLIPYLRPCFRNAGFALDHHTEVYNMTLLNTILANDSYKYPFLIIQSSLAQSALPILNYVISQDVSNKTKPRKVILFCLLYSPSTLWNGPQNSGLQLYNWTDRVPGFYQGDLHEDMLEIIAKHFENSDEPTTVILDSVDTLLHDIGATHSTYKFLTKLNNLIKTNTKSRFIIHTQSPSPLVPLLTQTNFSASLVHLIAHPPSLISHMARDLFVPPPPLSPEVKFWNVFIPMSERVHDTEHLVFGSSGEGCGHPNEIAAEVIIRDAFGRKRGVERILEGWSPQGTVEILQLESLSHIVHKEKEAVSAGPDPTKDLPFNLNLTTSQQESRAQVPLPYVHEGQSLPQPDISGAIFYDPDSADDIDDDDPDEDLDI
ncbi:hypothetical protein CVT24_011587 [Panaeolus cyanescens]|uniref:Elongator complex protein 5 n=1 Tax=Panaeolus cyanescens TaxID=181874 RepID=A0A409YV34_9AGAR|nr:hypothetical protein CVT24_011587 [Panaeolus cyanescens]